MSDMRMKEKLEELRKKIEVTVTEIYEELKKEHQTYGELEQAILRIDLANKFSFENQLRNTKKVIVEKFLYEALLEEFNQERKNLKIQQNKKEENLDD